jgi:aryl-alcohol dehydrogenase-like predicted oxidoreductase
MEYRELGRTGLRVSEISFGAWGIGGDAWIGASEDESVRALRRALDLGVNLIDTARGYGESERIVGSVVKGRDDVYVATKVPPLNGEWPAPPGLSPDETFPGAHIRSSLETSLSASGLDHVDILQLHVWDDAWVGRGDWLETVADLKREGKIRFFGVSINDHQPSNAVVLVRSGHVDAVQAIYNVFHQAPEEELLPACAESGVGVIVRVALDEGGLTGRIGPGSTFPDGDFRNSYFGGDRLAQVGAHVDALVADLGIDREELPALALRFVLADPAVSTIATGMRTVRNVERNAAVSDGTPLPAEVRAALAKHQWERDFYQPS